MLQELELQVREVYRLLDAEVARFRAGAGLCCPAGCGQCCRSEKVEATLLECLPLAFELFRTNRAELILKRLERGQGGRQCIFYRADFSEAGLWGCTQYPHRALICRLFGFAGSRDRTGKPQLALCRIMKTKMASGHLPVDAEGEEAPMPLFAEAGMRITALHPGLGTVRLPINIAVRDALGKVGMSLDLQARAPVAAAAAPELPPDKPLFPANPPRRRAA